MEQHQDEMLELHEAEDAAAAEAAAAAERAAHAAAMAEANLDGAAGFTRLGVCWPRTVGHQLAHGCRCMPLLPAGVETLLDDAAAGDAEWAKLAAVPGLLEPYADVRAKWAVATDEFKVGCAGVWGPENLFHTQLLLCCCP
jgi:hypothetical protein